MAKPPDGCAKPARGVIAPEAAPYSTNTAPVAQEEPRMLARVGAQAPDFETTGYFNGEFNNFKLSDYKGKWILVCFYPGDFTFV